MSEAASQEATSPERDEVFVYPASFAQQRLWFLDRLEPGSCAYNLPMGFRIAGPLNLHALQRSFDEVVRRHESLRTTFSFGEDGELQQLVHPHVQFSLVPTSLEGSTEAVREIAIPQFLAAEATRPFDLSCGPLFRASLVRLAEEEHLLLIAAHHIIMDGWSGGILVRELGLSYQAFTAGKPCPLPPLKIQYGDFAAWQRKRLQGETLENLLAFWKKQLGGAATLELPTDRPRRREQTFAGSERSSLVPKPLVDGLKRLARQSSATLFMVLLTALDTLLFRYTGQEDITVGSPIAGRPRSELEELIGFFANTIVLRTDLSGDPSFRQLLARAREVAMDAYSHEELPLEKLIEELKLPRDLGRNPLFQVLVNLQNTSDELPAIPGLSLTPVRVDTGTAKFDLNIGMLDRHDGLRVRIAYNTHLFDHTTIERMLGHLEVLLSSILSDPDQRVSELLLLPESERQLLVEEWNSTERDFGQRCVHQWFEQQAKTTPNRIAARYGQQSLSYAELNARANRLARYLRKLGVGTGVLTGLFVERSLDMLVGVLGVLKAGGAYVPLDPAYPKERVGFIVDDANAPVLLTQKFLLSALPQSAARVVCLDRDWKTIARESSENLGCTANAMDLAYVLYTSGSTGKPKGVQVEHRNLANFLTSMQREPGIHAEDTLLAVTTLSFDIAGLELYLPLVTGAQVVIASREEASNASKLLSLLRGSKASLMQATPATWRMLIESGWAGSPGLKVLCGGEALPGDLTAQLLPRCAQLWNMYGPTETTIWSSVYLVQSATATAPVGRPIANTTFHILDSRMQPVPLGVAGELYIGGAGVARGYFRRPELTAEKFVADPFDRRPGARLYRTGDLAKYLPDGNVQYLGRTDLQVKIRGFRIELGEIESVLSRHSAVQQSVIVAREDSPSDKRLVGYIVLKPGHHLSTSDARAYLKQSLPDYMLPSAIVEMAALPMTPNGKVDRNAMPKPDVQPPDSAKAVPPHDEIEANLLKIWQETLKTTSIGITDNFFDLGGHSLLAVRLMNEITRLTGVEIPLTELFQTATIKHLANIVRGTAVVSRVVAHPIQESGKRPPFFAAVLAGMNSLGYVPLAKHLGPEQPFYTLQSPGPGPHTRERPYSRQEYEQVADEYVHAMRTIQPEGPYYIGGTCEGARIAFEMARILETQGQAVKLLAVIDTWVVENTQNPMLWKIYYYSDRLQRWWRRPWRTRAPIARDVLHNRMRRWVGSKAAPSKSEWDNAYWPGDDFVPSKVQSRITVFKIPKQPFYYYGDPLLGWGSRTSTGVDTHVIPNGKHLLLLREPYVRNLAAALAQTLERLHSKNGGTREARSPVSNNGNSGQGAAVVSVVIPAFRCAQYIAQAVESVLQQSFSDLEIIVVNDGSPDTPLLEAALLPYWKKIHYQKQATRGPSGARNAGILQARGKYVAFLDGDDYWRSDHLAMLMALFQGDAALDLAYCDCILLKGEKPFANAFSIEPQSSVVNFDSLLVESCAISTSSAVVVRESILKAGLFDEGFRRCEDFDMWLRLAFGGAPMAYHSDAQVFHRMNEQGLSADRLAMKRDRIRVYQKIAASLPITVEQQQMIRELVAKTEADCHVDEMKHALEEGNYQAAVDSGDRAKAIKSNWKLATSLFALRAAPRLFGHFYLVRAHMLNDWSRKGVPEGHSQVSAVGTHAHDHDPSCLVNRGTEKKAVREPR